MTKICDNVPLFEGGAMRLRRLVSVLANACAILLLGLVGVAIAGPSLVLSNFDFGTLDLYGPYSFSGLFTVDFLSSSWAQIPGDLISTTLYAVQTVSNTLGELNDFATQLQLNDIRSVVELPANDSLFASVPEPLGLSVVVSGIAALTFVRRWFRRGQQS